jgi:hypothetical protein
MIFPEAKLCIATRLLSLLKPPLIQLERRVGELAPPTSEPKVFATTYLKYCNYT